MFERVLAYQFAARFGQESDDGIPFHVNTFTNGVCSGAGGGSMDCSDDRDATID